MATIIKTATAKLPTKHGEFEVYVFEDSDKKEHMALIHGNVKNKKEVLVRLHSECLTGDVFESFRCDCHDQLQSALKQIKSVDCGAILYLRQEGRGIGLANKIQAYHIQQTQNMDTYSANEAVGHKHDERDYEIAVEMLKFLKIESVNLLTNNPKKIHFLNTSGIPVVKRTPIIPKKNKHNESYLEAKKDIGGHLMI